MTEYMDEYISGENIYDLYGIIYHSGTLNSGHYVSFCKNLINNEWYLFDDNNVLHIPEDQIESRINDSGAYVLFYKNKKDSILTQSL
jgi:ubiquitin carboxyl-terminal hydrolase 20/33